MDRSLQDLRIVEISAFVAAPLGGMTMAQMGAEVIRIDPIGGGIDFARWPVTRDGASLYWAGLNKAKRSLALALDKPEGRGSPRDRHRAGRGRRHLPDQFAGCRAVSISRPLKPPART